MTEDFLGLFGKETDVVTLAPGDVLFEKNESGRLMYVVKSGEMQIIDGNYVYETVSAGGILGEMVGGCRPQKRNCARCQAISRHSAR
jgi:CRP/FNR family transcriptional regulator, cyclic AMP receptor protein